RKTAASNSRCALSRCTWASGGITSLMAPFRRWASTPATSASRSLSRLTSAPDSPCKANAQLAVFDRGSDRLPPCQHARQRDLATVVAHGHQEIAVLAPQLDFARVHEGRLQEEDVLSLQLLDPLRAALVVAFRRVAIAVDRFRHPEQHPLTDHLLVEERHVENR